MSHLVQLAAEVLVEALHNLKQSDCSYREMELKSGASNVSRLAARTLPPSLEQWKKLHAAFPTAIPEPEYTDGTKVFVNRDTIGGSNNTTKIVNAKGSYSEGGSFQFPTPAHRFVHDLLMDADESKVREIIKILMDG